MTVNQTSNTRGLEKGRVIRPFLVESFTLRAERCLNGWNRQANCSRCADNCPTDAVNLAGGNVTVSDACVHCGVCIRACPTEVFGEYSPPESYVLQRITHPHQDVWELACPLAVEKKDAFASQLSQANRLITPRCLGALGASHLLALSDAGGGQVWLNDATCDNCPIGHAHRQITQNVTEANGWLAAYGRPPAIFLTSQDMPETAPDPQLQTAVRIETPHPRRAFFRKALGLDDLGTAVKAAYIPRDRQRLLPILTSLKPSPDQIPLDGLNITNVQVDKQFCSACNLCARTCPTGALQFLADKEIFGLLFTAGSCVDCGICAMICPETAVSFTNQISAAELAAAKPKRLALGTLKPCRTCPALIPENATYDQCYICRQDNRPAFLK